MATLYLTEPYTLVRKEGDILVIDIPADKEKNRPAQKKRLPMIQIEQVVVQGDSTFTPQALAALVDQKVEITFLNVFGQFRARVVPQESRNSLLRLAQYRAHDDPLVSFTLAKQFVLGKIHNTRTLLMRSNRKLEEAQITQTVQSLQEILEQVKRLSSDGSPPADPGKPQAGSAWGSLQGLEGAASAQYFGVFDYLLRGDPELKFEKRSRRPPRDEVNALLSYGYTLLLHQCTAALQTAGFDPYIGYLHSAQYSKPSLALDLMEEFRAPVVDSVVLTLINNRVIQAKDFMEDMGSYRLKDNARRDFLMKFEERMTTEIQHPVFEYKATYRRCIELQARLLAKTLLGELEEYSSFKVR